MNTNSMLDWRVVQYDKEWDAQGLNGVVYKIERKDGPIVMEGGEMTRFGPTPVITKQLDTFKSTIWLEVTHPSWSVKSTDLHNAKACCQSHHDKMVETIKSALPGKVLPRSRKYKPSLKARPTPSVNRLALFSPLIYTP